jgi:esterase
MSVSLSFLRVGSPSASKVVVMLHGIYGWGRNWQAIAKELVAARPEYACVLIDLPHHGESGPGSGVMTVRGMAADVAGWLDQQQIAPSVLLGHSFGGKVALAMADQWRDRELQVWVVDSTPDTREQSGSAWDLLQTVRALPTRFASRDQVVSLLTGKGWNPGLAQWMATNLVREGDDFVWRLDFEVMSRLLEDFIATDLWAVVEHLAADHTVHFIKATESNVLSTDAIRRATAAHPTRVQIHHLEGSHWIHAERPRDVVALLVREL